ncbi:MAG: OmpH family outer membrane protein [bacterium]|nr:OmpH family outer membrane protein [bacterium]
MKQFFLAAVLGIFAFAGVVFAKDMKIAYINSQQIMAEFQESLDAQKQLESEESEYKKKLDGMEVEITKMRDTFEKQSAMMTEEKQKEKYNEIRAKMDGYEKFQRETWGPEGKLYQRNAELTKPILEKVNAVIKKIGELDGYDYIFDVVPGSIVYAKPTDDITQKILDELQKK